MLRLLFVVPFLFLVAACATTGDEVVKCGRGTYTVSASPGHPFGNYLKTSRNAALERASTFCDSKGRHLYVDKIEGGLPTRVTFRCLKEGDPELEKSTYTPAATNKKPCD